MPRDVEYAGLMQPEDVDKFLEAVRAGKTLTAASAAINWSLSAVLNRINRDEELSKRYAEARTVGAVAKADQVDSRMEKLAYEENPNASIVNRWAARHHPGYRERTEIVGVYSPPAAAEDDTWELDMGKVMRGLAEAGLEVTIRQDREERDGSSGDVSGPALLPAPAD